LARPAELACLFVLLGLAAGRPFLWVGREHTIRTDVQVTVVLDSSRSMLAAPGPGRPERWQRARAFARLLPAELPGVAIGLSSLTNRVLPYVFPTTNLQAYDLVLDHAYGIQRPPPALTIDRWVTVFDPLIEVTRRAFFTPGVRKHVVVLLTDAEVRPFAARTLLRQLARAHAVPVVVRFWAPGERIFQPGSESYRATEPDSLARLRQAGWQAFPESEQDAALRAIRTAVGTGPTASAGYARDRWSLAPFFVVAAIVPLLLLVTSGGHLGGRRSGRAGSA
jgi:hypothetical protein